MSEKFFHHIYIIAGLAIFGYAVYTFKPSETHNHYNIIPDTNKVNRITPYQVKPNNQPITIIVQNHIDTSFRKKAEKETIITGVKIEKGEVDVQEVDSSGKITQEKHKVDPDSKVIVTNKGVEEKKKTKAGLFLKKVEKVGKVALEIIGAVAILKSVVK